MNLWSVARFIYNLVPRFDSNLLVWVHEKEKSLTYVMVDPSAMTELPKCARYFRCHYFNLCGVSLYYKFTELLRSPY